MPVSSEVAGERSAGADDESVDVAIVGGGIAGVYAGWRLTQAKLDGSPLRALAGARPGGKLKVALYEGSNRIGGRLESLTPPGMPNLRAEFGGMAYSSNNRRVKALVEEVLRLPTVPFADGGAKNLNYLRGQYLYDHDFKHNPQRVPYALNWMERGKGFNELMLQAIETIIPNIRTLSPHQWHDIKHHMLFEGKHLYEIGFWNLLFRVLSNEAYALCVDLLGHAPFISAWNAAAALEWFFLDFHPKTTYRSLVDGYAQLPLTLCEQFTNAGGVVHMQQALRTIDQASGPHGEPQLVLGFDGQRRVRARYVVLAMPRRSLELIHSDSIVLREPRVHNLLRTVTPMPVFRLFLCYDYPWWEVTGIKSGRSVTDLPLRVIYYIGSERDSGGDPQNSNALLMASYSDGTFIKFWEGLHYGAQYHQRPNRFAESDGQSYWQQQPVSQSAIEETQRELARVHSLEYIPMPYSAALKNWSDDPYGGAWNAWNVGVRPWEVISQMIQPDKDVNLFVCGSAYSNWQGWVEGALETADMVLANKLGLAKPDWLDKTEA